VLLGGPSETGLKQSIESFVTGLASMKGEGRGRAIVSINEFDLAVAARFVAQAEIVISNDSGIGHLAIMLGKPSVLIVGGGHYGSFMPYPAALTPARVRFLSHLMPCYHCNWNCTMMSPGGKTFPCVDNVRVDQVWQAVMEITNTQGTKVA
jgi:ADP-heptose:LPS heptosyltransferase